MKEFLHKYGEDMKDLEIESLRQKLTAATDQIAAAVAACKVKDAALEQALDDMGEDGHCVCPAAKVLMQEALAATKEQGK